MIKENVIVEFGSCKPSSDKWLDDAKRSKDFEKIGIYLIQNGVVRGSAKNDLYSNKNNLDFTKVKGMDFSVDKDKVNEVVKDCLSLTGIYYLRIWINEGLLNVGDNIMQVLIGADCKTNCVDALNTVIGRIKNECVNEKEVY